MLLARVCAPMYICLSSPSSQSRITIPGMSVDDHRMNSKGDQVMRKQISYMYMTLIGVHSTMHLAHPN